MSDMMFFLSITYRSTSPRSPEVTPVPCVTDSLFLFLGVIGRYVYYDRGYSPTKEDIERSEILEGRLREGFVRIRQVMVRPAIPSDAKEILSSPLPC